MARVYSALIFEGHDLGPETFIELDPAFVWVVRDVDVYFPGPNAFCTLSIVALSSSGTVYSIHDDDLPPSGAWHGWRGRQVFVPIEGVPTLLVKATTAAGGADCRISGYRLGLT